MTEEEIEELLHLIELYKEADIFSGILMAIVLVAMCMLTIWEIYRYKKIKQMHREWKSTLNDEQLETLKRNREYLK